MKERLNKYLASCGITSRRKADKLIEDKMVKVNGKFATVGQKIDSENDVVIFNGKRVRKEDSYVYYALNKPKGVITSVSDPHGRKTVLDYIKTDFRVFPVGRLDFDSSGLVLLTNDGDLANKIMHPRYEHPKTYEVSVKKLPDKEQISQLESGVVIDGQKTSPAKVKILRGKNESKFEITIYQGMNRQIRKMCASVGVEVLDLCRTSIMNIKLGTLKRGRYRMLSKNEIQYLLRDNI